jgi:hypothetical protein
MLARHVVFLTTVHLMTYAFSLYTMLTPTLFHSHPPATHLSYGLYRLCQHATRPLPSGHVTCRPFPEMSRGDCSVDTKRQWGFCRAWQVGRNAFVAALAFSVLSTLEWLSGLLSGEAKQLRACRTVSLLFLVQATLRSVAVYCWWWLYSTTPAFSADDTRYGSGYWWTMASTVLECLAIAYMQWLIYAYKREERVTVHYGSIA